MAPNSVRPVVDGENAFPEVRQLVSNAGSWCYIANLAIDERLHLSSVNPRSGNVPSIANEIKKSAALLAQSGVNPEFKVLVWQPSWVASLVVDSDDYAPPRIDVGELSIVRLNWTDIEALDDDHFVQFAHDKSSSAPRELLLRFFHAYQDIEAQVHRQPWANDLLFPSGIHLALQTFEVSSIGSHHQKYVLTDNGGWVGGLNFLQDWWDQRSHPEQSRHARRFTSDDLGCDPDPSHPHDDPGPLHDTAVIIRGPVLTQLVEWFKKRWDDAIKKRGDYEHLRDLLSKRTLSHDHNVARNYVSLVRHLEGLNPAVSLAGSKVNSAVDAAFVADEVDVTVSLPAPQGQKAQWGGEKHEILDRYKSAIKTLQTAPSYLYIENQFFTDHRIAEAIYEQWKVNLHDLPFAVIVIPYKPHFPHWIIEWWEMPSYIKAEMQNLKWLEIKTARDVYVWGADGWTPKWRWPNPGTDVEFADADVNLHPEKLQTNSKLILHQPIPWIATTKQWGIQRIPNDIDDLTVADVISPAPDITGYTLLASKPPGPAGAPRRDGGRDILEKGQIYMHSKCSMFLNPPVGGPAPADPNWATVGTANLNPRSLDDNGEQDSELNIWWKQDGNVEKFRQDLWREHLEENPLVNPDIVSWVSKGWANYKNVLENRQMLKGRIVRLDVVDRYEHYKGFFQK